MKDGVCCHWGFKERQRGLASKKEKDTKREFSLESSHESAARSKSRLWEAGCVSEDFDGDGQSE